MAEQFISQGFTEVPCPVITSILPLRYPEIVRFEGVALYEKGDTQVLVLPVTFLPRTRLAHKPRTFALLSMPLDKSLASISGALRDPREQYSIVDQLMLDSYPSISPLPDIVIFAADDSSARHMLEIVELRRGQQGESGSVVVHNGRLLVQLQMT